MAIDYSRNPPLLIVGAGGHGRVVLDAALVAGIEVAGFVDRAKPIGCRINDRPVLYSSPKDAPHERFSFIVALGDQDARRAISVAIVRAGEMLVTVMHPRAIIAEYGTIGAGCFVAANVIVAPNATIGAFSILNHACTIDHDNLLAAGVQVCPGAHLAGNVVCEEDAFIGTGATICPRVRIGAGAIIGAGATVIRDVPPRATVVGTPARAKSS